MADFRPTFPFDPNIRPVTNNLNCAVNTITRYDMEFIKAYSDKELLHALCYQIANVIDNLWEYASNLLQQWLEQGLIKIGVNYNAETETLSFVFKRYKEVE